jgi:PAS domain S-box-containing protein
MSLELVNPVKILHLESSDSDVLKIKDCLKQKGVLFLHHHITKQSDFEENVINFSPDIVIIDYLLISSASEKIFSFINALEQSIPIILTSCSYSKELALEMAETGASDFIFKDQLERITMAVLNLVNGFMWRKNSINLSTPVPIATKSFHSFIQNSADAILLLNIDGTIIYQNHSAEKIFGHSTSSAKKKSLFEFVHPSDMEIGSNYFKQALLKPDIAIDVSYRILHAQGASVSIEGTITNFLQNEDIRALLVSCRDVTKKKYTEDLLQKSEANLRTIFDNTNVCYILSDANFQLISFNSAAVATYAKEFKVQLREGDRLLDYLPEGRKAESRKRFEKVLSGEKVNYELNFAQDDGSTTWYNVNMFAVTDDSNKLLGLIVSSENITNRKNIEFERNKMLSDIVQHNKNLEQFAYIISHNLRSPVANIIGLSALLENRSTMNEETFDKCMSGLTLSVKKLDEVIVDLNYILQTRRGVNEKKEFVNFSALIDDIKTSISSHLEKENIIINTNFTANKFFTIKSYLYSIFFNLISNSIKYRNPSVPLVIEIQSKKIDNTVFLEFKDNGLGIDLAAHGHSIFGLYKKFHTHIEGKGVGLYMVKTQVEILDGKITVASEVDFGTTFTIALEEKQSGF